VQQVFLGPAACAVQEAVESLSSLAKIMPKRHVKSSPNPKPGFRAQANENRK
jgi:hypothetical protein